MFFFIYIFVRNPFSHNPKAKGLIPYSPDIINLADKTAEQLGPYVAVHWRMETVSHTNNLIECAKGLVETLEDNLKFQNLSVFLLTDYPHSFSEEQQKLAISNEASEEELNQWLHSTSDTFHSTFFTPNHHLAIQFLYRNHPFTLFETKADHSKENINNWNLLPIPDNLRKVSTVDEVGLIDSGWLGILDKLTAIRSRYFLAGEPSVCARRSTFTAQIMEERHVLFNTSRNIQHFGRAKAYTDFSS